MIYNEHLNVFISKGFSSIAKLPFTFFAGFRFLRSIRFVSVTFPLKYIFPLEVFPSVSTALKIISLLCSDFFIAVISMPLPSKLIRDLLLLFFTPLNNKGGWFNIVDS